jgi:Na+/melibiose symporter-like transporter
LFVPHLRARTRTTPETFLGIVTAMSSSPNKTRKLAPIWRAMVEVGFIVFLFYSNLLMGEFTHSNGQGKSLIFGIQDVFTITNFVIAVISGLIGYVVVEYLRKRI